MSNTTLPVTGSNAASNAKSTNPLAQSQLNMQDFLQLMTTQLENQDPLNPTSDSEYFAQIAQLGTVQGIDTLNNSSQVQQAQSLMGKTVVAANVNAAVSGGAPTIQGVVQSLSIQNGAYFLGIQTPDGQISNVPISALQSVTEPNDISSASGLVGQTVTGTATVNGKSTTVTGPVTGVTMLNGSPAVTVQTSKTQTVTVPVGSLTSISS